MTKRKLLKIIDDQRHQLLILRAIYDGECEISAGLRNEIQRLNGLIFKILSYYGNN